MIDILSAINTAAKNMISLDNHAAKQLSLEERLLYLQGLALVMNADQEVHDEEREYLKVLIRSFEIDESVIDTLEEFSLQPDQDTIQSILRFFTKKDISNALLLDMFMIANSDGVINNSELAVIKSLSSHFKVNKELLEEAISIFNELPESPTVESFNFQVDIDDVYLVHIFNYFNLDDIKTRKYSDMAVFNVDLVNCLNEMNMQGEIRGKCMNSAVVKGKEISLDRYSIGYSDSTDIFFIKNRELIKDGFLTDLIVKCK